MLVVELVSQGDISVEMLMTCKDQKEGEVNNSFGRTDSFWHVLPRSSWNKLQWKLPKNQ